MKHYSGIRLNHSAIFGKLGKIGRIAFGNSAQRAALLESDNIPILILNRLVQSNAVGAVHFGFKGEINLIDVIGVFFAPIFPMLFKRTAHYKQIAEKQLLVCRFCHLRQKFMGVCGKAVAN